MLVAANDGVDRRAGAVDRPAEPSANATVEVFEFAEAKVNFTTWEVTVKGEPVPLTSLEMKLLRYFIEHEGRVIPRAELLERVWNLPGTLDTRAPDQFLRRLRKLFEADPSQPKHFLTIRDTGYRFVAKVT